MKLSSITQQQWVSIVINTLIAAAAAFLATIQIVGVNKAGATAGLSAALMAAAKIIQKAFTSPPPPTPIV